MGKVAVRLRAFQPKNYSCAAHQKPAAAGMPRARKNMQ